ncbi:MAG: flavodoxin domain-containing protein [Maricaulaceae bacterium]|jgi:menaquinone-dependent protoporphyrinogen oxidase
MSKVLVAYATTEGQTAKIAKAVAAQLEKRGVEVQLTDFGGLPRSFDLAPFDAVFLAASLHIGRYQAAAHRFAKAHAEALGARPSAFIAVSLSAVAEEPEGVEDAQRCADKFFDETGWTPLATHHAAGALKFSEYDFLRTWVMKRIAAAQGYDASTGEDMEFTDWSALDEFVEEFMRIHVDKGGE